MNADQQPTTIDLDRQGRCGFPEVVYGEGIDESVPPVVVIADGAVALGDYPCPPTLDGGFAVLELPTRDEAIAWGARIAKAYRCDQELRASGFDPQS